MSEPIEEKETTSEQTPVPAPVADGLSESHSSTSNANYVSSNDPSITYVPSVTTAGDTSGFTYVYPQPAAPARVEIVIKDERASESDDEAKEEAPEETSEAGEEDCPCEGDECPYEHQELTESDSQDWFTEADAGRIEEALEGGNSYRVTMLEAGVSKNRNYWSTRLLQQSFRMFEGTKAYADHPSKADMVNRPERSIKDIIGWYEGARFVPTAAGGKLIANLHLLEGPIASMVSEAHARGKPDLIQLSVNVSGKRQPRMINGQMTREVSEIHRVHSVDAVTEASAGGSIDQLVASANNTKEVEELMELDNISPEDLLAAIDGREDLKQAIADLKSPAGDDQGSKEIHPPVSEEVQGTTESESNDAVRDEIRESLEELRNERAIARCERSLSEALKQSGLPGGVQAKLEKRYAGKLFDQADLSADIEDEKATVEQLMAAQANANPPESVPWRTPSADSDESQIDRHMKAMEGLLSGKSEDGVKPFMNLRHAYYEIVGKNPFYQSPYDVIEAARGYDSGEFNNVLEATQMGTANFAKILGDSITRRAIKEYNFPALQDWRKITSVTNVSDLRAQLRERLGEFYLLKREATVAAGEGVTYADLTGQPLPETEATYQPVKAHGAAALTLEMIINDDLGKFRKIPVRLGRSAAGTIYVTVFNFLKNNVTESTYLTGGVAGTRLFSRTATRSPGNIVGDVRSTNDTITALNDANLTDAKVRFRQVQAAVSTAAPYSGAIAHSYILSEPRHLFVAPSNEAQAKRLAMGEFRQDYTAAPGNDVNVHQGTFDVSVIPYWETTAAADAFAIAGAAGSLSAKNMWFLTGANDEVPIFEIGFLNGREDPEIFVQDGELLGDMFTKDVITYKVRHFWGANPLDHRGVVGATNTS